jgi:hypothetical protein
MAMAGIKKIKIRKKTYKFDVRKRYQDVRHFRVRKRELGEIVRDKLKSIFAPKKEEKKKAVKKRVTLAKRAEKPAFNFALAGAAIGVALLILFGVWIFLSLQSLQEAPTEFKPQTEKPEISNVLLGGGVLNYGDRASGEYVASVYIDYSTQNIDEYNINITTYEKKIPGEVFVLSTERIQASSYPGFISHLRSQLSRKNIMVNEMTMQEIETIPEGAIVIIPSGAIPKEMVDLGSSLSPDALASKGMVVIYIGQPFTKMLDGSLVVNTPLETVNLLPFGFDETTPISSSAGFSLYQPLYRVTSTAGWASSTAYGSVSVLTKGSGAYLFVPQTLDGGWRADPLVPTKDASEYAAGDIARIILELPWAMADDEVKTYVMTGEEAVEGRMMFFSEPFEGTQRSVVTDFSGTSSFDPELVVEDRKIIRVSKDYRGELSTEGGSTQISTNITNQPVRMNARLDEPVAAQPNMFLVLTDHLNYEAMRMALGRVNVQGELPIDVLLYINKGEYISALMDDESKIYAQNYLKVVTVDIDYAGKYRNQPATYVFELKRDGVPVNLNTVTVVVDGGEYGEYTFNQVSAVNVDVSRHSGGDRLPSGDHAFTFIIGGLREDIIVTEPPVSIPLFSNPLFLITVVVAIGIAGLGVMFARKEVTLYAIDIPDFPPVSRAKIPISSDAVLSIFGKVNSSYHWETTPLTLSEIKNGFRDIYYQGKPIYITDYNTEFLLDELIQKGRVREALGYYGPLSWEQKTGRSMTYLTMMRKLRDICVNNAVPFTTLGESKTADSEITVVGQQMFLHFYEMSVEKDDKKLAELMKRALSTIGKGITIVLFKNDIKKRKFATLLDSPSTAQLLLKLEKENSSVLLLTMIELEKMVKELKSV